MKKLLTLSLISILALSSCRQDGTVDTSQVGQVVGAIAGAYAAKDIGGGEGNTLARIAGGILGAYLGQQATHALTGQDAYYADEAAQESFETTKNNAQTPWKNPQTGHYGVITPTQTYKKAESYCRDFTQTIHIDGKSQDATGTACRQPDGTWKIIAL